MFLEAKKFRKLIFLLSLGCGINAMAFETYQLEAETCPRSLEEKSMSLTEEALTKAAHNYVGILRKIGAVKSECSSEEILALCAKNCRKIRNGEVLFKGREFFPEQLDSGKAWLGAWSIKVCEILVATGKRSAIIHYELSTQKEGDLAVIVILQFDANYMISEINEVHNRLEK